MTEGWCAGLGGPATPQPQLAFGQNVEHRPGWRPRLEQAVDGEAVLPEEIANTL